MDGAVPDQTREFRLARRPRGLPGDDVFDLVETEVPDPESGQVVVETLYLSVDPYMRDRMREGESYADPWEVGDPLRGGAVARVVASEADNLEAGDVVVGNLYWAEHAVVDAAGLTQVDPSRGPLSAYLGVLGMPGRTAYFGMTQVAEPTPGDTVFVSAAAGAVGSAAGQVAKLAGARVVGTAGSDEKVEWLTDELGYDAAINYKDTDDYMAAIDEVAPEGIDCYFDNVGGPISDAVFTRLNVGASVAVCGQISLYNAESVPTGPRKLPGLIETRATVEGFLIRDFADQFEEATRRLGQWVQTGDIQYRETTFEGLENAPDAFRGLFEGENVGKMVVAVGGEA
jgi:NADPH-dependent curcumin reductase CurA